jgi:transcriptional antiterminator Rof (Rho-off)
MSHIIERCDVLDVLEESSRLHRQVQVQLRDGHHFVDQARDVVTADDGEWAVFRDHDRVLIDDISSCGPVEPPETSYRGKL